MNADTPTLPTTPYWVYDLLAAVFSILGISIILANGFVIAFYQKKWRESIPRMYIMMATCDSVTGAVVLCHTFIFASYGKEIAEIIDARTVVFHKADLFIITVYIVLQSCTRASLFYNTVLTVVRTINITRPFYTIKKRILTVIAILYPMLWVVLLTLDILKTDRSDVSILRMIFAVITGRGLVFELTTNYLAQVLLFLMLFMVIPLVLPAIIAPICAVIQIYSLLKPSIISPPSIRERRMTVTIIMLTMLCLACNIPYTMLLALYFVGVSLTSKLLLLYSLCTVLPFIQALLNPMILVSRGAALRQFVLKVLKGTFRTRIVTESAETDMDVITSEAQVGSQEQVQGFIAVLQ